MFSFTSSAESKQSKNGKSKDSKDQKTAKATNHSAALAFPEVIRLFIVKIFVFLNAPFLVCRMSRNFLCPRLLSSQWLCLELLDRHRLLLSSLPNRQVLRLQRSARLLQQRQHLHSLLRHAANTKALQQQQRGRNRLAEARAAHRARNAVATKRTAFLLVLFPRVRLWPARRLSAAQNSLRLR